MKDLQVTYECVRYELMNERLDKMIEMASTMVENGGGMKWQKKLKHLIKAKNELFQARYEL